MNEENNMELPEEVSETAVPETAEVTEKKESRLSARRKRGVSFSSVVFVIVITAMISILLTFTITWAYAKDVLSLPEGSTLDKIVDKLSAIEAQLDAEYIKEIDEDALVDSVMKGYMYGIGDDYADYYTQEEYESLMADLSGEGVGIGVSVIYNSEYAAIEVISVFPNSPAFDAGVKEGDLISHVYVDGTSVSVAELGYTGALKEMLGEEGTSAEFTVFRGENYSEIVDFSITRATYTETTVYSHLYGPDNSIGVIKITSFDGSTPDQFNEALKNLTDSGIRGIIFDVRYNPGGELTSVCNILDVLLPEGPVIRTVDKSGNEAVVYSSGPEETDIPMVVLVNGSTASAGELFTAALRDYEKASVVGTLTYGKGSMQTTIGCSDGTGFKYTYRYYYPPFSDNYDGIGLTPDVEVELTEELQEINIFKVSDEEDNQMKAAYDELLKQISK